MRITRVHIGSFGGIRDRDYRMDERMTVLYGPNESGKSSTMEFIRRLLSPSKEKKVYPAKANSDNGRLEVMDEGIDVQLKLDGKTVTGRPPECIARLDAEIYRSVFAMDPDTLDDSKVVTQGSIRDRFLTIPGGERMPVAQRWADDSVKDVVGLRSTSKSELIEIGNKVKDKEAKVKVLKDTANEFGQLALQLKEKEDERVRIESESETDSEDKRIFDLYRSNEGNYERLSKLREQKAELGVFVSVSEEDLAKYNTLSTTATMSKTKYEEELTRRDSCKKGLHGIDPNRIAQRSADIESLQEGRGTYRHDIGELSEMRSGDTGTVTRKVRKPDITVTAIGVFMIALGAVAAMAINQYTILISGLGAVFTTMGLLRTTTVTDKVAISNVNRDRIIQRMKEYEDLVKDVAEYVGIPYGETLATVERLQDLVTRKDQLTDIDMEVQKAKNGYDRALIDYRMFLSKYGGESGFKESSRKTASSASIDMNIRTLERALRSTGLDPDVPECPVQWVESGNTEILKGINQDIGMIREKMDAILDMKDLEIEMDMLASLNSEKYGTLRRGAIALLSKHIVEASCTTAFADVQPNVIGTANHYLGLMVPGASLEVDPLKSEVHLITEDGSRPESEWSSGLRAQILLSLKLAVAREMGEGKIPIVLDDVLLPFDSERKLGAVKALARISEEMQVIMFTCDAETKAFAESIGGITISEM